MMELKSEEILHLISELELSGMFEYIIIDSEFGLEKKYIDMYKKAKTIVWVSDGSEMSDGKVSRAFQALLTLEDGMDVRVSNRLMIIYNGFNNSTGKMISGDTIKIAGGTPKFSNMTIQQILERLAMLQIYDKLM
jgi:septum formation inhibitor-activating ATPase MinD